MGLSPGTRLGPYEIVAPLGAGGMGEVYQARDTRLERTVAIKVLPPHLSANPDLRQRFEREAKAISSLNHPHICTLHDVGHQDGTDFLVMEYLEGDTLAARLRKGALPLAQVLTIGMEIANALDKAHRQGLVHRDLKPGNVMLTKAGAKLVDFGLAKQRISAMAASSAAALSPATPTMSVAALSSPASPLTQDGHVVGTFQYLAPEVLQGGEADARSDLFAFGCVLYEMATGRPAFEGKSQLSVLTAILEKDPEPVRALVPTLPRALEQTITSCLAKDPAQRLQSAHDIELQLSWIGGKEEGAARANSATSRLGGIAAAVLLLLVLLAGLFAMRSWPSRMPVLQTSIVTPEGMTVEFVGDLAAPPTLSPDGSMVVLRARNRDNAASALWIRHLDSGAWQRLEGTEKADFPFWSPDSRNLGFFTTDGKMRRTNVNLGTTTDVVAAPAGRGGSWGKDGMILFAPDFQTGLFRVSADGGTPTPVTKLDHTLHTTHRWPMVLPDGKHFLYFAASHLGGDRQQNGVYFSSLDGGIDRKVVATDGNAIYAAGYLLFRSEGALQARRFDPSTGDFKSEALRLSDDIQFDSATWHISATASETGMLLFAQGGQAPGAQFAWFDRAGKSEVLPNVAPGDYLNIRLSPDARRIAVVKTSAFADIWAIDTERGTPTRLTFDANDHFTPVWSPDGKRIAYGQAVSANATAQYAFDASLHILEADGSGKNEEILPGDPATALALFDWTKDGKYLLYSRGPGPSYAELWALPLFGDRKPFAVITPPSASVNISEGKVSYDGHWLAYTSDESGRPQVYITSFPVAGAKVPVSSGPGLNPAWRRDGKELFYGSPLSTTLMAVDVIPENGGVRVGDPRPLFSIWRSTLHWDARGDGQRIIVTTLPEVGSKPMTLISNWTMLLNK